MSTKIADLVPLKIEGGVRPTTENTALSSTQWVDAQGVRFYNGKVQKIGGWMNFTFDYGQSVDGTSRMTFSAELSTRAWTLIGTNTKLYALLGTTLVNITPLDVATNAIPNSLSTHFATLGANPLSTVNGSNSVTIVDSDFASYVPGDVITLAGAAATGGITAGNINGTRIIRSMTVNGYVITAGGVATSTTTGGGAAVTRSSGLVTVAAIAHTQLTGDRTKITLASAFGGITAPQINAEFIIRNATTNTFDVMTAGVATSSATAAGGAATLYQREIPDGFLNESFGQGYGMGKYGVGLYGVSKLSTQGHRYPRIWMATRFSDVVAVTPGNGEGIYIWTVTTATAPVLLTTYTVAAPAAANYVFESDEILISFGENGVQNRITGSDQNNFSNYTGSSTNQVYRDDIEGAGRFLSHLNVNGVNLLFTDANCYTFKYIGLPNVWSVDLKDPNIGIIAQNARTNANGVGYFMGPRNFYEWDGSDISIMEANTQDQSTLLNYVFNNLNWSQKSKCFSWYNQAFNEVWFHYPSQGSNECNKVARYNIRTKEWTPDSMGRTSAEWPISLYKQPRLMNVGTMYKHESGTDADTSPLPWSVTSNRRSSGKDTALITGFVPDSLQVGAITVTVNSYDFPQSPVAKYSETFPVTVNTERVSALVNGRFWDYTLAGAELGQTFTMGNWQEYLQGGPTN